MAASVCRGHRQRKNGRGPHGAILNRARVGDMMSLTSAGVAMGDATIKIRKPAVAGTFYPLLRQDLEALLAEVWQKRVTLQRPPPKVLIAPHAGYVYSGPVAATAYSLLQGHHNKVTRVVLLGPSHHYAFQGFAVPEAAIWASPLGLTPLHVPTLEALVARRADTVARDLVHSREHSLEVHLPMLQHALGMRFELIPILVGQTPPAHVAEVLDSLWGGPETLIVVSTDLSHYHDQSSAQHIDAQTAACIAALDERGLAPETACGCHPVAGLLHAAKRRRMRCEALDVRTSGDTAGDPSRVVGYGAFALWEPPVSALPAGSR